jgi:geranylgeranyl reductase family protein
MTRVYDVAVVGAGPAGSATAALLAERGFTVALLERAALPRPKPCAEYLSPEALRMLDVLGVRAALDAEGPVRLAGMRVVSPAGTPFTGRFAAVQGYRGHRDYGLALPREILDAHLAAAATARGAELLERTVVEGMGPAEAGGRSLAVRCGARRDTLKARLVVAADGLNSRVARWLGLARRGRRRRLALVTHAAGVLEMGDVGEMHVGALGYVGLAPVGRGLTNVALVVDAVRVTRRGSLDAWFEDLLGHFPEVADRMAAACRVTPVRAAGPFARWSPRATADRVLLVGDAADFYDPFTGEGIYAALRGAELAVERAAPALEADRLTAGALASYDAARRREFWGKWIVERIVSYVVSRPGLFDRVAARYARKPSLADLLVGVTGDFVPATQVLKPSYLWRLVT